VAELFEEVTVPQGAVIFREGDTADATYILAEGAVDVSVGDRKLARLAPGETLGTALATDDHRRATATAAIDCRLLLLRREQVPRFQELQPADFSEEFSRMVARSLDMLLEGVREEGCQLIAFRSESKWGAQRRFLRALAETVERESGRPVAVATFASARAAGRVKPLRANDRDWVLAGELDDPTEMRARVNRELGERMGQVGFVFGEVHESVRDVRLGMQADVLVQRVEGETLPEPSSAARRVIFLHDRRDGPGPPVSSLDLIPLAAEEPERTRGVERLARSLCGHSVGLALGSGAAWGLAHIGVLEVLEDAGVPVDVVAGASMGAIVGAHYALGMPPSDLHEMATRVKTLRDFLGIMPELLYLAADFNPVKPGLFAGEHFKKVLASIGPITDRTFNDLRIPFRAVATDIETGARAELREGELADAVHASFAAPAILSPYRIGDGVYIDGGMVDPVPAETARRMGADLVIAVNVVPPLDPDVRNPLDRILAAAGKLNPLARLRSEEQRRLPGGFDALMRTIQLMQYQLGNDRAGDADVLINPELKEFWLLEFWAGEPMIARGAEAARNALPLIQEKLAAWRKAP